MEAITFKVHLLTLNSFKGSKGQEDKKYLIRIMKLFLMVILKEDQTIIKISLKIKFPRILNIVQKESLELEKADLKEARVMELTI